MKRKYYIFGIFAILFISLYFVDREVWMKKRIFRHSLWDYETGSLFRADGKMRDLISTDYITSFNNDTMIFDYGYDQKDTLVLKWEYFGSMKVLDPRTGKTTTYGMKGANWIDYCFGRYSR